MSVTTTSIVYYCERRHQYFRRKVTAENDLIVLRKLNRAIFRLCHTRDEAGHYHDHLAVYKIGNTICDGEIESSSVPKYLFGDDYFYARRKDTSTHWNLTRDAFIPREPA